MAVIFISLELNGKFNNKYLRKRVITT